jgi:DNA-binding response OmpR family regulator
MDMRANRLRILLIEDDPETAEYIVVGLQNEMHDLEVAACR